MSTPRRLAEILQGKGVLSAQWKDAVENVPRHFFLPDRVEAGACVISRAGDPESWLAAVYDDVAITTQVNFGETTDEGDYRLPTSSSSMPSMMLQMLQMLDLLDVQDGQRVLELGAGTGWNAAWLAHRLGDEAVTSVDMDPVLVEQAVKNTQAAGYHPRLVCGDGDAGWPSSAPYERVLATYTVCEVPFAWVEQAPGGRIVAPWGGSFLSHSFAVLDVEDGSARGRFTGYPSFMRTRNHRPERGYLSGFIHHRDEAVRARSDLSPLAIAYDAEALFFVGLALPTAWYLPVEAEDDSGEVTVWFLADDRSSWAAADYSPSGEYWVTQYGPRRLWDEAQTAYVQWRAWGEPTRDQAGMTVDATGQSVWLGSPDHVIA
ncbi:MULTISPECIES: methyltransferase domain-containing protein [unclassified Streptomyces]|uniref:Protein-L-isoaspartate O-methyltransferase n=1 Tax=Streptomyces sp. NBC_00060 TaxID=2975636 RepID=A0AAU2H9W3_9ACTN